MTLSVYNKNASAEKPEVVGGVGGMVACLDNVVMHLGKSDAIAWNGQERCLNKILELSASW